MMKRMILAGLFALVALPALAAPPFLPQQDVDVSYALTTPGQPAQDYQMQYDAAGRLARVESPQGIYILADLATGQAQVVVPALRATVQAPDFSALTGMIANADGARFTPLGPGLYAGLACEKYLVLNAQGSGTACLTPQGVVLHFNGQDPHGSAQVTALSVTFAPQPAQDFTPPQGYSAINLPPGALAALLQQP